jgi:sterol desaturase/sphingolipid hydroxylase (fatty acid hydroxylase superfamily)
VSETFLGFPLQAWGILSLAIAVAYFIKWPKPRPDRVSPPRSALAHIILRWFHSLVWLLLALACILWASGPSAAATALAVAALIVYLIFLATLLADRARD